MVAQVLHFNRFLFGGDDCLLNWKLPIEDGVLGEAKFMNWYGHQTINEINRLDEMYIPLQN